MKILHLPRPIVNKKDGAEFDADQLAGGEGLRTRFIRPSPAGLTLADLRLNQPGQWAS
jgi:hypothetical protein